jgi:peptidoglycan/xylan/chitin deacetylase (PgdA/CDA1 family)
MPKMFLLRYDTECGEPERMKGFFEKAVEIHRRDGIPATFFCSGGAIDSAPKSFAEFYAEVKDDPLFDIQDHSYTHIGLGYADGRSVDELRADYERSFDAHQRVFGVRPIGVSICGVGDAGPRLRGFDETEKARAEFAMIAEMGVRMINAKLTTVAESEDFISYASIGHPDVMGFPSGYSDTGWMVRAQHGDPMEYILGEIRARAERGQHMPLMLHEWVAWDVAPGKELSHVREIIEVARKCGYALATHVECLSDTSLWQEA